MPSRQCLGCGRLTSGRSYCRRCSAKNEKAKQDKAPWLRVYKLPEWKAAKWAVHDRDGFRCTYSDARGRCTTTSRATALEAHHVRSLRHLWRVAGYRWGPTFLQLALDRSNLVTLCFRHHQQIENPGRPLKAKLSARPTPKRRMLR